MTTTSTPVRTGKDWLPAWDPESSNWDSGRAWKTLWVTTYALTLGFITWFLASAIAPKLNSIGFDLSQAQLYWLIAMPGLAGGTDASNTDPYATKPDKNWVKTGPHVMIVGADPIFYDQYPKDAQPDTTVPYVMWPGTPYQHLMIPVK